MPILETVQTYGTYKEIAPGEYAGPCPRCGGAMRFRIRTAEDSGRCRSCDYAIPCAAGNGSGFDAAKMLQMIADARSRVKSARPAGAMEWVAAQEKIWPHLQAADRAVDAAFESEDEEAVKKALSTWENRYLAAWQRYQERPPVIERQEALFDIATPPAER